MSSHTASLISVMFFAVNGGGVYSRASRRDALSTVVVVAGLPRSDAFALDPGENASRDAFALVRRDADSNLKSFRRRGASARASRISLAPSRRRRASRRTARGALCDSSRRPSSSRVPRARRRAVAVRGAAKATHGPSPAARPSVRGRPLTPRDAMRRRLGAIARDAIARRTVRARRDAKTRTIDARRRATSRATRFECAIRFEFRIWIGCDAMRSDATRFGEREDDDATRTDESTTRE